MNMVVGGERRNKASQMVMYARKQQRLSDGCHDRRGDSQPFQVPADHGVEGLKGLEGEGRDCYSSAGFKSRYRPFGATNLKVAPLARLKFRIGFY